MDQTLVSLVIVLFEIIEKPPPLPYEHEETPAGVVILHMYLEVLCEMIDALTEQGNLHLRRSGIGFMEFELPNNLLPLLLSNPHVSSVRFLSIL
jgi:hypothetical protein